MINVIKWMLFVTPTPRAFARRYPVSLPERNPMTTVAVIAHSGKTFGGGLGELRRVLDDAGFPQPLWYEVDKTRG